MKKTTTFYLSLIVTFGAFLIMGFPVVTLAGQVDSSIVKLWTPNYTLNRNLGVAPTSVNVVWYIELGIYCSKDHD
ncbi:MAG: hypothetical protein JW816_00095 [Candidatus Buchananbacteria bacterium]|nr:hypothetical protein [Candidatus Buchananbacteria bacterium]